MMVKLKHGHITARSTVLAAQPARVKDKSGEAGHTAVRQDPINDGHRKWERLHGMRERLTSVGLKRRGGRVEVRGWLVIGAVGRRYMFFWQCYNKGTAGVGVFIAERWIDSVVNVVRVNEQIMYVKLVIGKQMVNIVSSYAP